MKSNASRYWLFSSIAFLAIFVLVTIQSSPLDGSPSTQTVVQSLLSSPHAVAAQTIGDPHRVIGLQRADCKKCHPSEVAAWMKTSHYSSTEKLEKYEGNTKKYADALGIAAQDLMGDSLCADCHGTKAVVNNRIEVISGVSCESCHGESGGVTGWLNRHQSYDSNMPSTRQRETPEHREARFQACDEAGMIRAPNLAGMAEKCLSCHIIKNEQLIAAGHKSQSTFDFVGWTSGEIRHNYFVDRNTNAPAPSLWLERTSGGSVEEKVKQRQRLKLVIGTLKSLELALRQRATLTNPAVIPQVGGNAAALNGKLAQINAVSATPETTQVAAAFAPMLGTIFAPLPTDKETYTKAADNIAKLTEEFLSKNDGSKLGALDGLLQTSPPYYSQKYKDKFGSP